MEPGLTIRLLEEQMLQLRTVLITRAEDDSRLLSEFVRSTMRKLIREEATQRALTF